MLINGAHKPTLWSLLPVGLAVMNAGWRAKSGTRTSCPLAPQLCILLLNLKMCMEMILQQGKHYHWYDGESENVPLTHSKLTYRLHIYRLVNTLLMMHPGSDTVVHSVCPQNQHLSYFLSAEHLIVYLCPNTIMRRKPRVLFSEEGHIKIPLWTPVALGRGLPLDRLQSFVLHHWRHGPSVGSEANIW